MLSNKSCNNSKELILNIVILLFLCRQYFPYFSDHFPTRQNMLAGQMLMSTINVYILIIYFVSNYIVRYTSIINKGYTVSNLQRINSLLQVIVIVMFQIKYEKLLWLMPSQPLSNPQSYNYYQMVATITLHVIPIKYIDNISL